MPYPYNAILINTKKQEVSQVKITCFNDLYKFLECRTFEAPLMYYNMDTVYVDEEGLFVEDQVFFHIQDAPQPYAGNALIIGTDDEGESIDVKHTVEQVRKMVTWL